jgi:hypothetical protein
MDGWMNERYRFLLVYFKVADGEVRAFLLPPDKIVDQTLDEGVGELQSQAGLAADPCLGP